MNPNNYKEIDCRKKYLPKIILVALPETTPMREAEDLQNDLKRVGIPLCAIDLVDS